MILEFSYPNSKKIRNRIFFFNIDWDNGPIIHYHLIDFIFVDSETGLILIKQLITNENLKKFISDWLCSSVNILLLMIIYKKKKLF